MKNQKGNIIFLILIAVAIVSVVSIVIPPLLDVTSTWTLTRAMNVLEDNGYSAFADTQGNFTVSGNMAVGGNLNVGGTMSGSFSETSTLDQVLARGNTSTRSATFGTITSTSTLNAATGRGATFLVAASNASDLVKAQADYICDGTADQVQIQAALDSLSSNGGKVQLSEGTFNISDSIVLSGSISFSGMGAGNTILFVINNSAFTGDAVIDYTGRNDHTVIEYIEIDGNRDNQINECSGIELNGSYMTIQHNYIHDMKSTGGDGYGLLLKGSDNCYNNILYNTIDNTDRDQIMLRDLRNSYNTIVGNTLRKTENITFSAQNAGIQFTGSHNYCADNYIDGEGQTWNLSFGFTWTGGYNQFINNTIKNLNSEPFYDHTGWTTAIGNYVENISGGTGSVEYSEFLSHSVVKGNTFVGPIDVAAIILTGSKSQVIGNHIYTTGYTAGVDRIGTGINVRGNDHIISGNFTENTFTAAIKADLTSCDNLIITDNIIKNDTVGVYRGIDLNNNVTNSIIANNTIECNSETYAIDGEGNTNKISGNVGYTNDQWGTDTLSSDDSFWGTSHARTVLENSQGFGNLLGIDSDGTYIDATCGTPNVACVAMAVESGTGTKAVIFEGEVRDNAWDWSGSIGDFLYLGENGDISSGTPSTSDYMIQVVGVASGTYTAIFNPSMSTGVVN